MRRAFLLTGLLALAAAACRPDREATARAAASSLSGVLSYPGAVLMSAEGDEGAGQLTFETVAPDDTVAAWYRQFFRLNGWELKSDSRDRAGGAMGGAGGQIVMYAERDSAGTPIPVWVMIRPNPGPAGGSVFSLISARPGPADTATPRGPR